jgi:hypothetical protein
MYRSSSGVQRPIYTSSARASARSLLALCRRSRPGVGCLPPAPASSSWPACSHCSCGTCGIRSSPCSHRSYGSRGNRGAGGARARNAQPMTRSQAIRAKRRLSPGAHIGAPPPPFSNGPQVTHRVIQDHHDSPEGKHEHEPVTHARLLHPTVAQPHLADARPSPNRSLLASAERARRLSFIRMTAISRRCGRPGGRARSA